MYACKAPALISCALLPLARMIVNLLNRSWMEVVMCMDKRGTAMHPQMTVHETQQMTQCIEIKLIWTCKEALSGCTPAPSRSCFLSAASAYPLLDLGLARKNFPRNPWYSTDPAAVSCSVCQGSYEQACSSDEEQQKWCARQSW